MAEEAFSELWAGIVEDFSIHIPLHRAVLTVRTVEDQISSWYEIQFEGISRLVFADDRHGSWRTAWIEEAVQHAEGDKTRFNLTLSEIEDSLEVTCTNANVVWLGTEEQV